LWSAERRPGIRSTGRRRGSIGCQIAHRHGLTVSVRKGGDATSDRCGQYRGRSEEVSRPATAVVMYPTRTHSLRARPGGIRTFGMPGRRASRLRASAMMRIDLQTGTARSAADQFGDAPAALAPLALHLAGHRDGVPGRSNGNTWMCVGRAFRIACELLQSRQFRRKPTMMSDPIDVGIRARTSSTSEEAYREVGTWPSAIAGVRSGKWRWGGRIGRSDDRRSPRAVHRLGELMRTGDRSLARLKPTRQ
jgi:hypothetical protein